jgi:glycosyltransferase involved in cell wall biosynthesis
MRGRVLVIDHGTPTPDRDSGSASAFLQLRILARAGFDVTFAPISLTHDGPYTQALGTLGVTVLTAPRWTSLADVVDAYAPQTDVLILSRAPVASMVFDQARRVSPATKILFDTVDLHFLRMQREAALSGDEAAMREARDMRALELGLIRRSDATLVVSRYEQDFLRELIPGATVRCVPVLREIPPRPAGAWGWRRSCARLPGTLGRIGRALAHKVPDFDTRRDIVFIGGYLHRPNVDAVLWFCREVWPLVLRRGFSGRFIVAGADIPAELSALASETIEIRGHVPDLAALFDSCRLSVAPLRYGAGIKGKIVSSLSHGVPMVSTSIAAEGMGLRHGRDILIADEPDAIADGILRLYDDRRLWRRLSRNGYEQFIRRFSVEAGARAVVNLVDSLVAKRRKDDRASPAIAS